MPYSTDKAVTGHLFAQICLSTYSTCTIHKVINVSLCRTRLPIFTVDAFTDKAFSGNPAAVMLLEDDISDAMKQKIAR